MSESFKEFEIICPNCGEKKNINIPTYIFSQKKFGIIKIQIPVNAVCSEHPFIVFVDTKGTIRGYEKVDIQLSFELHERELKAVGRINIRNLIRIFGVYGLINLMHALIFNYPSYILKDDSFEYSEELLNSIGDILLPDGYKGRKMFFLLEEVDINKIKIKEKNAFVIDTNQHIFQTPWKTKLNFEEEIIGRALDIIDEQEQLTLLQHDIANFISKVNYAVKILENVDEIFEDDLKKQLAKGLMMKKVSNYYFDLIREFIMQNISKKFVSKIKSRLGEFLNLM